MLDKNGPNTVPCLYLYTYRIRVRGLLTVSYCMIPTNPKLLRVEERHHVVSRSRLEVWFSQSSEICTRVHTLSVLYVVCAAVCWKRVASRSLTTIRTAPVRTPTAEIAEETSRHNPRTTTVKYVSLVPTATPFSYCIDIVRSSLLYLCIYILYLVWSTRNIINHRYPYSVTTTILYCCTTHTNIKYVVPDAVQLLLLWYWYSYCSACIRSCVYSYSFINVYFCCAQCEMGRITCTVWRLTLIWAASVAHTSMYVRVLVPGIMFDLWHEMNILTATYFHTRYR